MTAYSGDIVIIYHIQMSFIMSASIPRGMHYCIAKATMRTLMMKPKTDLGTEATTTTARSKQKTVK